LNSKPRKKAAKRRSKKGRSRGGLKLLLSAFLIACILLVGAFYLLDVRVKVKSDNALIAKTGLSYSEFAVLYTLAKDGCSTQKSHLSSFFTTFERQRL